MKAGRSICSPSRSTTRISWRAIQRAVAKDERDRADEARVAEIQERVKTLTPRETEVFALVVTGMLNKQIAAELGIGEKTVKVHRARVMEKMQAGSVAELVRLADEAGVIVPGTDCPARGLGHRDGRRARSCRE